MAKQLTYKEHEKDLVQRTILAQKTVYSETVRVTKHLRRVRALRLDTRTPKSFQRLVGQGVRNPLPWSLVQTITGMISKGTPQFDRLALRPEGREAAADLAATCWPLIQTFSRIVKKDLAYLFCDQLTGDGIGVAKLKRHAASDYPVKKGDSRDDISEYNREIANWEANPRSENPFSVSMVDSATFWPDRSEEPEYVLEFGRKALLPMLNALNLKLGTNNALIHNDRPTGGIFSEEMIPSGFGNSLNVGELWTKDHVYFDIGGELAKFENELGFIPYAWRYGMTTSIPDPALERVSTVFPFFALDPYINTVLTGILTWGIMASMPTMAIETTPQPGPQNNEGDLPNVDIPLGQMVRLRPGQKLSYVVPPPMGTEAVNVINMMMSFYDRAGVTSAARGNIGTRTPGLTFSAALEAAGDMVKPIETGLAGLFVDIVQMTWRAATNMNVPLNITGYNFAQSGKKGDRAFYKVTPKMIDRYYDVSCELQSFSDATMQARGQFGSFMADKKLWSKERAMKHSGVNNPEQERREILLDEIRESAAFKQQAAMAALAQENNDPEMVTQMEQQIAMGVDPLAPASVDQALMLGQGMEAAAAAPAGAGSTNGTRHRPGLNAPASGGGRAEGAPRRPTGPGNAGPPTV